MVKIFDIIIKVQNETQGNYFFGTMFYNILKHEPLLEVLNKFPYSAIGLVINSK